MEHIKAPDSVDTRAVLRPTLPDQVWLAMNLRLLLLLGVASAALLDRELVQEIRALLESQSDGEEATTPRRGRVPDARERVQIIKSLAAKSTSQDIAAQREQQSEEASYIQKLRNYLMLMSLKAGAAGREESSSREDSGTVTEDSGYRRIVFLRQQAEQHGERRHQVAGQVNGRSGKGSGETSRGGRTGTQSGESERTGSRGNRGRSTPRGNRGRSTPRGNKGRSTPRGNSGSNKTTARGRKTSTKKPNRGNKKD